MELVTYTANANQAVGAPSVVGLIIVDGDNLPVLFKGPSVAHVTDAADTFWLAEQKRMTERQQPHRKGGLKKAAAADDVEESI